jgi:pyruvate/2-oxoglutarate dehydrogenase complex dihydrolipoamide dehydrogenase (E3) component
MEIMKFTTYAVIATGSAVPFFLIISVLTLAYYPKSTSILSLIAIPSRVLFVVGGFLGEEIGNTQQPSMSSSGKHLPSQ